MARAFEHLTPVLYGQPGRRGQKNLLLLPGLWLKGQVWDPLMPYLSGQGCFRLDWPGRQRAAGQPPGCLLPWGAGVRDYFLWVQQAARHQPGLILVGLGWGGRLALSISARYGLPALAFMPWVNYPGLILARAWGRLPGFSRGLAPQARHLAAFMGEKQENMHGLDPQAEPPRLLWELALLARPALQPLARKPTAAPRLILGAQHDPLAPAPLLEKTAARLGASCEVMAATPLAWRTRPQKAAQAVQNFLQQF